MLLENSLPLLLLLFYLLLVTATLAIWFILTYRPSSPRSRKDKVVSKPVAQESQRARPQADAAARPRPVTKPLGAPSKRTIDDPFSAFRRSKRDDEF